MASANFIQAAKNGYAFSFTTEVLNVDATDTALLIRNLNDMSFCIESVEVSHSDAETEIELHCPSDSTTALAGTAVTPVSLNRRYAYTGLCEAMADETGIAQGVVVDRFLVHLDTRFFKEYDGSIEIDKGKSIAIDVKAETGEFQCTIIGFFIKRTTT